MRSIFGIAARLGIQCYAVRIRPLTTIPPPHDLPPDMQVELLDRETLIRAARDEALELSNEFIERALARGDVACGAIHGGRLIAYLWRTSAVTPHRDGLWVRVTPPYHYGYKGFTHPQYRGQHINSAISFASDAYFLERGFTHLAGFVDPRNTASLATGARKGLAVVGYAGYAMWFGRCFPFRTRQVAKIGFEFTRAR